jgi:hypothetical protein
MAVLTQDQVNKIAELIRQHTNWFIWKVFGKDLISAEDLKELKESGLLPMEVSYESIKYSYVLGKLEAILKKNEWKNLTWDQLMDEASGAPSAVDKLIIDSSNLSAVNKFRKLEQEIKDNVFDDIIVHTNHTIVEAAVRGTLKDTIKTGMELDQSYREVARNLRETFRNSKRDWIRVAVNEMHHAHQRGSASAIANKEEVYERGEGIDSQVYVAHDKNSCPDCQRLYMDPGTGNPKIFTLKELMLNEGTNYIRPWRQNAKPVIPPLHPHCSGRIVYLPKGWGFDEKGSLTVVNYAEAFPALVQEAEDEES